MIDHIEPLISKHDKQLMILNEQMTELKVDLGVLIATNKAQTEKIQEISHELKVFNTLLQKFTNDFIQQQAQILNISRENSEVKTLLNRSHDELYAMIIATEKELKVFQNQTKSITDTFIIFKHHWMFICGTVAALAWLIDWAYRYLPIK